AEELFGLEGRGAGQDEMRLKAEKEKSMKSKFKKAINVSGLDNIFAENMDHPVWQQTAEDKCLSCANCVMVCPTCFCYDLRDEMSMDLKTVTRYRCFDACQDIRFAEVHGGNFRQRRAARLRQFVTHKLDQTNQYGVFGTVGCGRCITWCPTGIDLTEITKEIQRYEPA
ncbi:MAG: 4Fe-4S dicluster domain-containing protein, partial [Nitrospirota bacterium]